MRAALLLVSILGGCSLLGGEAALEREIEAANYCEAADDCVLVGSVCPFGCSIYVNEAEADRIERRLDRWVERCMYDCVAVEGVACNEGRCEAVLADTGR